MMLALRWVLGITLGLLAGSFLTLFLLGNVFRRSFGASDINPVLALVPLLAGGVLFASLVFPGMRPLLHLAALAAIGLTGFCLWQLLAESAPVMVFGLIYLAAWFLYYWMVAWRTPNLT